MSNLDPVLVYPWGLGSIKTKHPHTEPIGIARVDQSRYHVVKVNWHTSLDTIWNTCKYRFITKAEYDMHLAFDTLPVLKVKYKWLSFQTRERIKDNVFGAFVVGAIVYHLFFS